MTHPLSSDEDDDEEYEFTNIFKIDNMKPCCTSLLRTFVVVVVWCGEKEERERVDKISSSSLTKELPSV